MSQDRKKLCIRNLKWLLKRTEIDLEKTSEGECRRIFKRRRN